MNVEIVALVTLIFLAACFLSLGGFEAGVEAERSKLVKGYKIDSSICIMFSVMGVFLAIISALFFREFF